MAFESDVELSRTGVLTANLFMANLSVRLRLPFLAIALVSTMP